MPVLTSPGLGAQADSTGGPHITDRSPCPPTAGAMLLSALLAWGLPAAADSAGEHGGFRHYEPGATEPVYGPSTPSSSPPSSGATASRSMPPAPAKIVTSAHRHPLRRGASPRPRSSWRSAPPVVSEAPPSERQAWEDAYTCGTIFCYSDYLEIYADGPNADKARARIRMIVGSALR